MRPIDGDAMMNVLDPQHLANRGIRFAGLRNGRTIELARLLLIKLLEDAPTIDAAPVVHGKWRPTSFDPADPYFRCSVCHYGTDTIFDGGDEPFNYCPNCGAKMDGGVSDG